MTDETIRLCLGLLDQVSIPSTAPDLVEQATRLQNARKDLEDALAEGTTE